MKRQPCVDLVTTLLQSPEQEACTRSEDDLASIWNIAAQSFFHHVKCLLKFIKKVPGRNEWMYEWTKEWRLVQRSE